MIVTLTNVSGRTIHLNDSFTSGVSGTQFYISATGGNVIDALPYPFNANTNPSTGLAASGTKVLSVHVGDYQYKAVHGFPHNSGQELNMLVQRGVITLSTAAETGNRDVSDLFTNAV